MTTTQIIILVVAVVALIALLAARVGGPRVTQIDRTVRREKDDGEDER
jgi:hypothetical protein